MAPAGARTLLVVGCGRVGSLLPAAYRAAMPIDEVLLWDRTAAHAEALAQRLRTDGINARATVDLQHAAGLADIVSCATLATTPIVQGLWLRPHSHLDLIGSFTPLMREADDACFAGARLVVDTPEALQKSGELLGPMARGVFTAESVAGTLADLCRGATPGRLANTGRSVFKSVGTALEDLAAAKLVWHAQPVQGSI
jgi:ornithine cyclodeaminase